MSIISRRTALTTGAALVNTGAIVAPPVIRAALASEPDDAVLLARIDRFHDAYDAQNRVWAKQQAHQAEIEARPDCPALDPATCSEANFAFLQANDAYKYSDEIERLYEQATALVNAIFETPARTTKGAFEKIKIAYTAIGDGEGSGDEGLLLCQNPTALWMAAVVADLERLALEARP
jgi:hypothetical protein